MNDYKINKIFEGLDYKNNIVNIGESFLVFSFRNKEMETEEQFNEDDLILKIYSNEQEYDPIIIQDINRVYQVGRSDKYDINSKEDVKEDIKEDIKEIRGQELKENLKEDKNIILNSSKNKKRKVKNSVSSKKSENEKNIHKNKNEKNEESISEDKKEKGRK